MKNGLLIYNSNGNLFNIGDYIQSLAAKQHFQEDALIFINRERLNEYSGDNLKLIMNGWFMHEPQNWPPSNKIKPLLVSFHINSTVREQMIKPESVAFFKKFEPVGCRDQETVRILKKEGIDAFFSGCLTLTLGKTYKNPKRLGKKIYFIDPHFEFNKDINSIFKYTIELFKNLRTTKRISKAFFNSFSLASLIKSAAFINSYRQLFDLEVLKEAIYINHVLKDSDYKNEEQKFKYATELLNNYADAKFVVTSRIHCALPCLSLETPVIYVENDNQSESSFCRLEGLRELFNIVSYNKGRMHFKFGYSKAKVGIDYAFQNKPDYMEYKNNLIDKCLNFTREEI